MLHSCGCTKRIFFHPSNGNKIVDISSSAFGVYLATCNGVT